VSDSDQPKKAVRQHGRVYRDEIERLREIGGASGHLAVLYAIRLLGRDSTTRATEATLASAALMSTRTLSDRLEELYASGVIARPNKRKFGGRRFKTIRPVGEWRPIPNLAKSAMSTRRRPRGACEVTSRDSLGDLATNVVPEHSPSHESSQSSQSSHDDEGLAPSGLRPTIPPPVEERTRENGHAPLVTGEEKNVVDPLRDRAEDAWFVLVKRFPSEFEQTLAAVHDLVLHFPDRDAVQAAEDFVKKVQRIEHPSKSLQVFEAFLREARPDSAMR